MGRGRKDTPEEAKIREEIKAKGVNLSPGMVLKFPKEKVEPLVMEGLTNFYLAEKLEISAAPAAALRRFYGLPSSVEVNEMLACVKVEPDESLEMEITLTDDGERTEVADFTGRVVKKPEKQLTGLGEITEHLWGKSEPKEETPMTINEARVREGLAPLKEMNLMQTYDPPLLDIESDQAAVVAPLVNGIAKMLDRMGKTKVSVTVVVKRV